MKSLFIVLSLLTIVASTQAEGLSRRPYRIFPPPDAQDIDKMEFLGVSLYNEPREDAIAVALVGHQDTKLAIFMYPVYSGGVSITDDEFHPGAKKVTVRCSPKFSGKTGLKDVVTLYKIGAYKFVVPIPGQKPTVQLIGPNSSHHYPIGPAPDQISAIIAQPDLQPDNDALPPPSR